MKMQDETTKEYVKKMKARVEEIDTVLEKEGGIHIAFGVIKQALCIASANSTDQEELGYFQHVFDFTGALENRVHELFSMFKMSHKLLDEIVNEPEGM